MLGANNKQKGDNMVKHRKRIVLPHPSNTFDPSTDTPLRDFPVSVAFVRCNRPNNYKLFCNNTMVLLLSHDGFIYTYASYQPIHQQPVETFIRDYAPHISLEKVKPHLKSLHFEYIGLPQTVTL